jgi:hypothetical protein
MKLVKAVGSASNASNKKRPAKKACKTEMKVPINNLG